MADSTKPTAGFQVFELCSGGGCCPVMRQYEDRSIDVTEDGVAVKLDPSQADALARRLRDLGYGG